jgi:hypothetical protein
MKKTMKKSIPGIANINQSIVDETGFGDGRRKHNQAAPKHRGNTYREPKWMSGQKAC